MLFVDDFATNDVHIRAFVDPETAIREIIREPPDLVFLDYRLPNTTGDEVAMKIDGAIPRALISGDLRVQPSQSFVKIFSKPYDSDEMGAFIQSYVTKKKVA